MSDTQNVTAAKPKIGGAVYSAPLGTALPVDAVSELNEKFKVLGYISEDGMTNSNSPNSETIKAWGGDTVNTLQTEKPDTFSYTLIEALNIDVLKEVYGSKNVTGTLEQGISIKANSNELEEHCLVFEMILKNNILKRIVLPRAQISELGDITYADGDNVGYETTVQALPDLDGNTHYEYIKQTAGDE